MINNTIMKAYDYNLHVQSMKRFGIIALLQ